ncbi:MAG: hypothetical protein U1F65_12495 [Verrucomicrobiota bacterium]
MELPISFDGAGKMEVDLLNADTKVVIELDRAQHLGDEEACRRDRRKAISCSPLEDRSRTRWIEKCKRAQAFGNWATSKLGDRNTPQIFGN